MKRFLGQSVVQEWSVSRQMSDLEFNVFIVSHESRANSEQQQILTLQIDCHTAKPVLKVAKLAYHIDQLQYYLLLVK